MFGGDRLLEGDDKGVRWFDATGGAEVAGVAVLLELVWCVVCVSREICGDGELRLSVGGLVKGNDAVGLVAFDPLDGDDELVASLWVDVGFDGEFDFEWFTTFENGVFEFGFDDGLAA